MLTPNMEERASPLRARPILSLRPMVVVVVGRRRRFGLARWWPVLLLLLLDNGDCWPAADTTGGKPAEQGVTQATYVAD